MIDDQKNTDVEDDLELEDDAAEKISGDGSTRSVNI